MTFLKINHKILMGIHVVQLILFSCLHEVSLFNEMLKTKVITGKIALLDLIFCVLGKGQG